MNEQEFQELIHSRGVVIVHFSHCAVMSHSVEFPEDLRYAISNYQAETRSCCALWPGHNMALPGSVGVIFSPKFDQLVSVLADDSGSSNFSGEEMSAGQLPSKETIVESLRVPAGRYNEWRVRGASPTGIFVSDVASICAKKKTKMALGDGFIDDVGCTSITLSSVLDAFPDFSVYTFDKFDLKKVTGNGV